MGEVLENGVYLPDEGERNAYNGLKGNWNTVDTVVAQVQALSSTGLIRKAVDALPTEDIETNVIYMLKAVKPNGDVYRIEYMYIDNHWDALGTSETTLDDYYTKAETDDLPAVKSGINATKVSNYDAHLANNDVHVTLANKQSWDGKQAALDANQTAAVNSGVNATKVTGYDTHVSDTDIHVTTSDKTAWNSKQDGLSQTQLAAVNSGITEAKRTGYDNHVADTNVHVTTADKAAWNGKQNALTQTQLDNIAAVPDKANSADLATVATTGDYGDLLNAPTIPAVNNATLTIQKNGADVATFTANASSNVTANLAIPTDTSDLTNGAGFLTQHNPIDDELSATSVNALQNKVIDTALNGKAPLVHTHAASDVTSGTFNIARIPNLDASKITSGTIDIARLPKGALERLVKVANQAARYALTADDVQLGDTVQQLDTGVMYVVTDETKLDSADGYTEFTAGAASSVPWTGVTGKPNDYPPSSHTHTKSQITDFPTLATVATSGEYSDLNNIPASFTPSSHSHGNITNDGKVGTAANKPLITGTGGVVQAGSFGTSANTFCEGNDSRLSDARTPVAHTHTKSDITDLFNSANTWTGDNTYSKTVAIERSTDTGNFLALKNTVAELGSTPASATPVTIAYRDKNNDNLGYMGVYYDTDGSNLFRLYVRNKFTSGSPSTSGTTDYAYFGLRLNADNSKEGILKASFRPYDSNTYDLGSSSYQWNNLYAKNYYYNGTAWGLDKDNQWLKNQSFIGEQLGNEDSVNTHTCLTLYGRYDTVQSSGMLITRMRSNNPQGGLSENAASRLGLDVLENGVRTTNALIANIKGYNSETGLFTRCELYTTLASSRLGTSTNKWKTFNGINPGALSLPDYETYVDVTSNVPVASLDGSTQIDLDTYLDNKTGWLSIVIADTTGNSILVVQGKAGGATAFNNSRSFHAGAQSNGYISVFFPIISGASKIAFIKASSLIQMRFYYCLGNV